MRGTGVPQSFFIVCSSIMLEGKQLQLNIMLQKHHQIKEVQLANKERSCT